MSAWWTSTMVMWAIMVFESGGIEDELVQKMHSLYLGVQVGGEPPSRLQPFRNSWSRL